MVDGGVPEDEELYHVLVTLPAGQGQGGVIIATRRHIDLSTGVKEKLGGLKVALSGSRESVCACVCKCVCMCVCRECVCVGGGGDGWVGGCVGWVS